MEVKAPAAMNEPKDAQLVSDADSSVDNDDPPPGLVESLESGGKRGPEESDGSDTSGTGDLVPEDNSYILSDTKEKVLHSEKGHGTDKGAAC